MVQDTKSISNPLMPSIYCLSKTPDPSDPALLQDWRNDGMSNQDALALPGAVTVAAISLLNARGVGSQAGKRQCCLAGERHPRIFQLDEALLDLKPSAIAGQVAMLADDPVAGNDDGNGVAAVGGAYGPYGRGITDALAIHW